MNVPWILVFCLVLEFFLRLILEIYEQRKTGLPNTFFFLRLIPLLNDFVPIPESKKIIPEDLFVKEHENAHKVYRHAILRNLLKVIYLCLAVGVVIFLWVKMELPFWQVILWMHLIAFIVRPVYHFYCWNQEFESDAYAFKKVSKKDSQKAMKKLLQIERPHTFVYALFYREHPTAVMRYKKLFG